MKDGRQDHRSPERLRERAWKRFLQGPDTSLLDELYVPALGCAVRYDRCCAYFSSSVLSAAARGFAGFIGNLMRAGSGARRPAARLLVNEQMDPADVDAMLATGDDARLAERLLRSLRLPRGRRSPAELLQKERLRMLAWLVREGWLEVKVGVMRDGQGILHAKYGLVTDAERDCLGFTGSGNETGEALTANYEQLEVRGSWEDPEFVEHYRSEFEKLWRDEHEAVRVVSLPEAVREKLISFAPKDAPVVEPRPGPEAARAAMVWRFLNAAPFLPGGETVSDATAPVDLWPHQRRVVEDVTRAFPAGRLLCDEVGMGKTIEAALALRRLLLGRGVRRALLLVPAGLMRQWQEELREKAGLVVPRFEPGGLHVPGRQVRKMDVREALGENLLILSREWARLKENREELLAAEPWDLVLLDEAHAARRREPGENSFNSANLLLQLLRELQLRRRARGILLLSATPMQTDPWEPWDLLTVLGVGGPWMVEFSDVRAYYDGLAALNDGWPPRARRQAIERLVQDDDEFPPPPDWSGCRTAAEFVEKMPRLGPARRPDCAAYLRRGAPLGRRMHRNTRDTLREYYRRRMIDTEPPRRRVSDEVFDYGDPQERKIYEEVTGYIDRRYEQLEKEKTGKGFVMTVYRRRASSSPLAIQSSLERRLERLDELIRRHSFDPWLPSQEDVDLQDLADEDTERIDAGLPDDPALAEKEKRDIESLLSLLEGLQGTDSKFASFFEVLERLTGEGRIVLVFTEYYDTMEYLRRRLDPVYGDRLACYSGKGGLVRDGGEWKEVGKAEITSRLQSGGIGVLVCTDAASEGLNLQSASALINYDLPWNPSKVEQRIGRVDRIGQQASEVPIHNMFLKDSVDMRVYQALRRRCGLFEHFVGPMQPVLAEARRVLRQNPGKRDADQLVRKIEQESEEVKGDVLVASAFARSEGEEPPSRRPLVTRSDLEEALGMLRAGESPVQATRLPKQAGWRLEGRGLGAGKVALTAQELERGTTLEPLTPGMGLCEEVVRLMGPEGISPLVVVEAKSGPYRCAEARWVGFRRTVAVEDLGHLKRLLKAWDGAPPDAGRVARAEREARKAAVARLEEMRRRAEAAEQAGLERQVEAARRRLKRELARTLLAMSDTDPARTLEHFARQPSSSYDRFRTARRLLGVTVEWSQEEIQEAREFVRGLGESARQSRQTFSEIDAALNDPRWKAAG